jgi:DtxR family Mn-dependent transcriptional regulator
MIGPLAYLIITALVVLLATLVFWPRYGLFWQWKRGFRSTQRVLLEDALKHLYDQEYNGVKSTLQSVSGALEVASEQALQLLARLEAMGLIKSRDEGVTLTPEGRSYALRMIRIHRLWERYLADQTGLVETQWHVKAEKLEHNMSEIDVQLLAERAGHASYDPHGDPIPTPAGDLPPKKGQPLTDLGEGEHAKIIHLEDEPGAIYAQLIAEGLYPGMRIRVLQKTAQRISFVAEGDEIILAPVLATNVSVETVPVERPDEYVKSHDSLASLELGESGEVTAISTLCRGQQRRRIMDLGVIPGTIISAEMRSPSGDPTAYQIRGATIALRKSQAEMIHIKPFEEAA